MRYETAMVNALLPTLWECPTIASGSECATTAQRTIMER